MQDFISKHEAFVIGHLSGWDRVRFMGTLRLLSVASGMMFFLSRAGVLLKNLKAYVEKQSECIKAASLAVALDVQRPHIYLNGSSICKEDVALRIREQDGIQAGLVCTLSCVEPCRSYAIRKDPAQKKLVLESRWRKCLHIYHYMVDEVFGWMNIRIQTWFPFTVQICINGREWLARRMDQEGIHYIRRDNCFTWIEDLPRAQTLMDELLKVNWPTELDRIAKRANPGLEQVLAVCPIPTYWSARKMRRGIADLHRRAEVSQAANNRYLEAMASLDTGQETGTLLRPICRRVNYKGRTITATVLQIQVVSLAQLAKAAA